MKLWQIAALVALGIVVGEIEPNYFGRLFHFATFHVFLPAIIFEAAWQLDLSVMRQGSRAIVLLAVPGVAITAAIIAVTAHYAAGIPLATALVLGAVLSATDPVAVTAIFRRLAVPELLATIVESESLLNDAIAVVLYRTVLAVIMVATITGGTLVAASLQGVLGSALGIVVGIAVGFVGSLALRRNIPGWLQIAVTFAAAYGAYAICDRFDWSGIFATIACAMTMRELQRQHDSVEMTKSVEKAWNVAANLSNAVLFFLIGASVEIAHLWHLHAVLLWTLAAVVVSRSLLAYGLLRLAPSMGRSWMTVVRLAGVRGAVSLALALSVPAGVPGREIIIEATFAVVIATVLIGSMTYGKRIASLDL